jgi:hypothetical protein
MYSLNFTGNGIEARGIIHASSRQFNYMDVLSGQEKSVCRAPFGCWATGVSGFKVSAQNAHFAVISKFDIALNMNSKQKRTLIAIYSVPVSSCLAWKDIESLFVSLEIKVIEGNPSRVRFHKDGMIASFHRPHPKKEAKPYQVKDASTFLRQLGVEP